MPRMTTGAIGCLRPVRVRLIILGNAPRLPVHDLFAGTRPRTSGVGAISTTRDSHPPIGRVIVPERLVRPLAIDGIDTTTGDPPTGTIPGVMDAGDRSRRADPIPAGIGDPSRVGETPFGQIGDPTRAAGITVRAVRGHLPARGADGTVPEVLRAVIPGASGLSASVTEKYFG